MKTSCNLSFFEEKHLVRFFGGGRDGNLNVSCDGVLFPGLANSCLIFSQTQSILGSIRFIDTPKNVEMDYNDYYASTNINQKTDFLKPTSHTIENYTFDYPENFNFLTRISVENKTIKIINFVNILANILSIKNLKKTAEKYHLLPEFHLDFYRASFLNDLEEDGTAVVLDFLNFEKDILLQSESGKNFVYDKKSIKKSFNSNFNQLVLELDGNRKILEIKDWWPEKITVPVTSMKIVSISMTVCHDNEIVGQQVLLAKLTQKDFEKDDFSQKFDDLLQITPEKFHTNSIVQKYTAEFRLKEAVIYLDIDKKNQDSYLLNRVTFDYL